jgi:hypothetical protein
MRITLASVAGTLFLSAASFAACASAATVPAESQVLPQSTAIPVRFEHSIDTKKAKAGDTVTAKTMQLIVLPDGKRIAKGSLLVGHVASVQAFSFDPTPYAHQKPSTLSIHFDKLQAGNESMPVNLSVRALANVNDSVDASYGHSVDNQDSVGMMTLIGGMTFSPLQKTIQDDNGDAIAYNRRSGLFARLIPSGSSGAGASLHCDGTDTEQSLAIFSPDACGVYGFAGDYLAENGRDGSGTFTLATRGSSIKLYAGSTALLQVNDAK